MWGDKDNDLVPEVSWDFNTYSTGNVETINGMDRKTGTAICFSDPTKADNPWVSKKIHEDLTLFGRTTLTLLKSDREEGLK